MIKKENEETKGLQETGIHTPSISIIIPTYNRKNLLSKCLQAIGNLKTNSQRLEVLVVDDGSTDGTEETVQEIGRSFRVPIHYFKQENRGPASARNLGVENAKGEYVAFLDDDCVPDSKWLIEILKGFSGEKIAGVGGRTTSPDTDNLVSRYCKERKIIGAPIIQKKEVLFLITSNAVFRRKILQQVGGFSHIFPSPGGEDLEICVRLLDEGYNFSYVPDAIVYHHHRESLLALCKTFSNWGSGWSGVAFLHSRDPQKHPVLLETFPEIYNFSALFYIKCFIRKNVFYLLRYSISNAYHFFGIRRSILDALFFTFCDFAVRFSHLFGYLKGYFKYKNLKLQ